ncbi:MAG: alpha/beta fold hydrolase [Bryobacteraceae bacterium]|jgi:pimeloyl-ACP methyl ester carboxylesterase
MKHSIIPAPGTMVETGAGRLHVHTQGQGEPVVVLEAGIAASSLSWSLVQHRIAAFTTVVSYDRAGFGWSDRAAERGTALHAAEDLARMLDGTGLRGPFILVGHSFGGLIVRLFQQRYPDRVAGLVLVDPVVRSEWRDAGEQRRRMLARGVALSRRGAFLARIGVVRFALNLLTGGSQTLPRLLARASAGKGAGVTDRLVGEVRKMPRDLWPAIASHWSQERSFRAMADNLENLPRSAAQLDESASLGDLPLVVLSAAKAVSEHQHDAGLSTQGRHIVVADSGHWMQLDAPDAVVQAVADIVAQVRQR